MNNLKEWWKSFVISVHPILFYCGVFSLFLGAALGYWSGQILWLFLSIIIISAALIISFCHSWYVTTVGDMLKFLPKDLMGKNDDWTLILHQDGEILSSGTKAVWSKNRSNIVLVGVPRLVPWKKTYQFTYYHNRATNYGLRLHIQLALYTSSAKPSETRFEAFELFLMRRKTNEIEYTHFDDYFRPELENALHRTDGFYEALGMKSGTFPTQDQMKEIVSRIRLFSPFRAMELEIKLLKLEEGFL